MALRLSIVVIANGDPDQVAQALESARAFPGAERFVAGDLKAPPMAHALVPYEDEFKALHTTEGHAAARNAACVQANGTYLVVVDGHERLASGGLEKHLESLEADSALVASYGRTAVQHKGRVRVRPESGKGGSIYRRLLKEKNLISSSASLVWRRDALDETPFASDLSSGHALRLALALDLARDGAPFAFHPSVVAERSSETLDIEGHQEMVKIFLGVLYSPDPLEEKTEQRARFRLARHLVAIGKLHYREGDYRRAGKFFDEAVKAAPGYFKGRRYQFLNFIKNTLTRERE